MSKVAIQGNASGTGTFTIAAPNSNTDRTLTLPDEAGTVLTSAGVPVSALPTGSILQVVSSSKEDVFSTTSTTFVDVPDLSVNITPSSTSSEILVMLNITYSDNVGTLNNEVRIVEDGVSIHSVDNHIRVQNNGYMGYASIIKKVSPTTTNQLTYKAQVKSESASYTLYINRRGADTNYVAVSSITVMEIAG